MVCFCLCVTVSTGSFTVRNDGGSKTTVVWSDDEKKIKMNEKMVDMIMTMIERHR